MSKLTLAVTEQLAGRVARANALADLAVTGRESYRRFVAQPPTDATLMSAVPNGDSARAAVQAVLDRAYTVAWALRGDPAHRASLRPRLGWIAVSGEDDPAHAPVNCSCTSDHMGEIGVNVAGIPIKCRAALKLGGTPPGGPAPDISARQPPGNGAIFDQLISRRRAEFYDDLVLFIHGLGSRLEESEQYKQLLIERMAQAGQRVAILSLDLPGKGYSTRLDLDDLVARRVRGWHGFSLPNGANSNFPLLGLFRDTLVAISRQIPGGIQHTMGGSLGGNLTLWLAESPMFSSLPAGSNWLSGAVSSASWSPASTWESYERSRDTPLEGNGTHMDVGKNGAKKTALSRMRRPETDGIRRSEFFEPMHLGERALLVFRVGAWGFPPHPDNLLLQSELYGPSYRRTFWMAAYEQVTFSHQEPIAPSGDWPFRTITQPLLLASGANDQGSSGVMDIYNSVIRVTEQSPRVPGQRLLLQNTGHSISDERPRHLADRVAAFLSGNRRNGPRRPPHRIQVFTNRGGEVWNRWQISPNRGWNTEGFGSLRGSSLRAMQVAANADGRLEVFGLDAERGAVKHRWQVSPGAGWNEEGWLELEGRFRSLAVGVNQDGRPELFGLDAGGAVSNRWQTQPNGAWNPERWGSLGRPSATPLTQIRAGSNADGRLEVFGTGGDGMVYHRWQTGPNGGWNSEGWASLQGTGLNRLCLGNHADGRLEIFALDNNGVVHNRWQVTPNGGWNPEGWGSHGTPGGTALSEIHVATNVDGRLELFGLGRDGNVYIKWQVMAHGGWIGGWRSLQGNRFRQLSVAKSEDGRLELFAINPDGAVQNRWQQHPDGRWNPEGWGSLGGTNATELAAI